MILLLMHLYGRCFSDVDDYPVWDWSLDQIDVILWLLSDHCAIDDGLVCGMMPLVSYVVPRVARPRAKRDIFMWPFVTDFRILQ
jgi:hypothetical protein